MRDYGLKATDADVLIDDKEIADCFEKAVSASKFAPSETAKLIANWMISELFAILNKENKTIDTIGFPIEYLAELVDLIVDKTISGKIAKTVFAEMVSSGHKPSDIVNELGLVQIQDEGIIRNVVEEVLAKNPSQVEQYKAGKTQLFGFFVGQSMKAMQGKGNPETINTLLQELLEKL